ncbi:type VII secretion-associated protein [Actinokineospora pegani]|uniref:type VII secretion-associated protein n=1 Tax=Actinokineospora pegani TaxID=2654637 RepID=UPI0012EA75EF|nr:type VII secretion-associated protein [Actinokineospora pegani]
MGLRVAVDFGTSSTCVAIAVDGREPQVVVIDGQPLLRSAVYVGADGTLFVGQEAERQAALDPSRYEPHPKRRVDEGELLLGDTVLPVRAVFRAVLSRAVREARRVAGGAPVDQLVLTHPADWGAVRTAVLAESAAGLGQRLVLVPEPVAAAVFHAARFPGAPQQALAVLDVGGGTVDVSIVAPAGTGFTVLAAKGDPSFGGADVDQSLMDHIGSRTGRPEDWRELVEGRDLAERRRRRVLRQDVRDAKETLSRHPYTDVPLPSPFPDAHVTRDDLEALIAAPVGRAADLVVAALAEAGLAATDLTGLFLVGGASRIPMVARVAAERTGVVPVTLDQPETVVARGALLATQTPAQPPTQPRFPVPPRDHPRGSTTPWPTAPPGRPPTPGPRSSGPGDPRFQRYPGALTNQADRDGVVHRRADHPQADHPRVQRRSRTGPLVAGGAVLLAAAVVVGLVVVLGRGGPADPGRVIAQYEYRFALPAGWTQTGGDPALLRTEIKPQDALDGEDRILVEEKRLSFDSGADRARAVEKLRGDYEAAEGALTDFADSGAFAGKSVVRYRERLGASGATVDWYVLFEGSTQVSVGCQHTDPGRDLVQGACAEVVRSLVVTG